MSTVGGTHCVGGAGYILEGEGVTDPSDEQGPGVVPLRTGCWG